MTEQHNFTIFDSPMKEWGGEWHGFESRVREAEQIANGYWFGGMNLLPYRTEKHPALAEVEILAQADHTHAATPRNVRQLLAHLEQPQIPDHNIPFDKAQIAHLRTLILQAGDLVLDYVNTFSGRFHDALAISPNEPPVHVNATLMRQMATDLRIAEGAMQQRLRDQNNQQSWLGYALYAADLLAYATIEPLKASGIIPQSTVIVTHLQQETDVRLIPYYDLLFVGLPLAMINVYDLPPRPYLAIPHEIGHFLYRYGTVQQGATKQRIGDVLTTILPADWRARWAEELFADIFGCLLAGPVSVLEFQALLADGLPDHLTEMDGKHPTPVLRPLIQSEILRQINQRSLRSYVRAPDLLDSHWQLHLNRYLPALRGDALQAQFVIDGQRQRGAEIINALRTPIGQILDLFQGIFGLATPSLAQWQPWSQDIPVPPSADIQGTVAFNGLLHAAATRTMLTSAQAKDLRTLMNGLRAQFDDFYFTDRTSPQASAFRHVNVKPPPPIDDRLRPTTNYQQQLKGLRQRLEGWQHGTEQIAVTDWRACYAVREWTTEGPRGSNVQ